METTVIEDLSTSISKSSTPSVRQTATVIAKSGCKICGGSARYSYYGAIVCQSCKMFFKRNAENGQVTLKCHVDNKCGINMNNRHKCSSCRLKKCFSMGMHSEMLRSSRSKNKRHLKKKSIIKSTSTALVTLNNKNQNEQIPTLNLLQSDQSTLTVDQSTLIVDQSTLTVDQLNLLSNLNYCFDQYIGDSFVESYIQDQNALHPKLRFKHSSVRDFFTTIKSKIQLVVEKNRDLQSLTLHDRSTLLRSTVEYTTSFGAMFIINQHGLFNYPSFYNSAELIFRPISITYANCVVNQLDSDNIFIKLILAILSFSTINYTIYTKNTPINQTNIKEILSIQDMYTEITWRYLLYKYNYHDAVMRFSNLIRCLFLLNKSLEEAHESRQFIEMIDSVIEQTKRTLCF